MVRLLQTKIIPLNSVFLGQPDVTDSRSLSVEVQPTMERLLRQEDSNRDKLITIEDKGPKVL